MKTRTTHLLLTIKCLIFIGVFVYHTNHVYSQCCTSNNYANASAWTLNGTGYSIGSGVFLFNATPCGAYNYATHSLGCTLSDDYVIGEIEFNYSSRGSVGTSHTLLSFTAGSQNSWNTNGSNYNSTNQDDIEAYILSPAFGAQNTDSIFGRSKKGSLWNSSSLGIAINLNTTYFIRIERLSKTQGRINVFTNSSHTIHTPGSPKNFPIDGTVTGLTTFQHGGIPQGSPSRTLTGTLANMTVCDVPPVITNNTIQSTQIICSGNAPSTLIGSAPSGGIGMFNFKWQKSTVSSNSGFINAGGIDSGTNYSPSAITTNTWFRRIVTSSYRTDTSSSILISFSPSFNLGFTINNAGQCINTNSFVFTDTTSQGGPFTRKWDIGNADTANTSTVIKTYSVAQSYQIKLKLTNSVGCTDSLIRTISVYAKPNATIVASSPTAFCSGKSVTINANTGSGLYYQWLNNGWPLLGDTLPLLNTNLPGTYSAVLHNALGCFDTSNNIIVKINPKPIATTFPTDSAVYCNGGSAMIQANSDTGLTYKWLLNGVPIAGETKSKLVVGSIGIFRVITTNTLGCSDTSLPVKTIMYNAPLLQTMNGSNTLYSGDTSTYSVPYTNGYAYNWVITNGIIQNGQSTNSVVVRWNNEKQGTVFVTISNKSGCKYTLSKEVNLYTIPNNLFGLYPSPTTNDLTLRTTYNLNGCKLSIIDMLGKDLWSTIVQTDVFKFDFQIYEFAVGTYILTIQKDDQINRVKFVKD